MFMSGDVVPFDPILRSLACVGKLVCPPRPDQVRVNICGSDLRHWRDSKCGSGLAPADFFDLGGGNGVRVDLMRISGPTPYETRCFRNLKAHYERINGRYVPPPTWISSNRGVDPTRVRDTSVLSDPGTPGIDLTHGVVLRFLFLNDVTMPLVQVFLLAALLSDR